MRRPFRLIPRFLGCGLIPVFALLTGGCETARDYSLTWKVWNSSERPSSRPAPDPRLALFVSSNHADLIVAYDALSERHDKIERRAFLLSSNDALINARKPPIYLVYSNLDFTASIPIVAGTNLVRRGLVARYPVSTDNGPGFELFQDGKSEGEHSLPVYDEGLGTASQLALTPLAVAGDTVMVGLVTGFAATVAWLQMGCPGL